MQFLSSTEDISVAKQTVSYYLNPASIVVRDM